MNFCLSRPNFFSGEGKWSQLEPTGDRPPSLQEHTAVAYKDCIYVFGGEIGFSAGTETPLWIYNTKVRYKHYTLVALCPRSV